ncbi:MAG: CvpA family protein [Rikenella sp.]|nr:CvpA family protein [Rikenella sp.]
MNTIDLIVCLVVAIAVWNGWRRGFIVQVCSLGALVAGLWLASRYGAQAGAWLRLDDDIRNAGGFVAVLIAAIIAIGIAARMLRRLFCFAGFGVTDSLLGVAVAVLKYLLLLSALFAAFDRLNADRTLVDAETIDTSLTYRPVIRLSEMIFPFVEQFGEQLTAESARTEKS